MLLVEVIDIEWGARISNEALALEHFWAPEIASLGQLKVAMDRPYGGGYVRPQYGRLELLPTTFADHWPPPVNLEVRVRVTDTDESGAVQLLAGTAHRTEIRRDGILYDLYGDAYTGRFTDHVYSNTVSGLFANNIAKADPELSADITLADDTNAPYISYTDAGDQVVIDSLSDACACAAHLFYIEGTTAYLVDMMTDNGSRTLTEFDFFPSSYRDQAPLATYRCGDTDLAGSYSYGRDLTVSPLFHTSDGSEVSKGLARIKTIMEMPRATLKMPITASVPKFGERISWRDESQGQPVDAWIRVRGITWDFDAGQVVIEGEGGIS